MKNLFATALILVPLLAIAQLQPRSTIRSDNEQSAWLDAAPYYANPKDDKNDLLSLIEAVRRNVRDDGGSARVIHHTTGAYYLNPKVEVVDFNGQSVLGGIVAKDTILNSGPLIDMRDAKGKSGSSIVFLGAGEQATYYILPPGSPGFQDPDNPRPLFLFKGASNQSNRAFYNGMQHLTIITEGNPGCIPIEFHLSNRGGLRGVTLLGDGPIGLNLGNGDTGPGLLDNVTVVGFKRGISFTSVENGITLNKVTVRGYTDGAITTSNGRIVIAGSRFVGSGVALKITGDLGYIALDHSYMEDTSSHPASSAVVISGTGKFLGRRFTTKGFTGKVVDNSNRNPTPDLAMAGEETYTGLYSSHGWLGGNVPDTSDMLPYRDAQIWYHPDTTKWVSYADYHDGNATDKQPGFQAWIDDDTAHSEGMLFIPRALYRINSTIHIGGEHGRNVKTIVGNEANFRREGLANTYATFTIWPTNFDTLYIERVTSDYNEKFINMIEMMPGSPVVIIKHNNEGVTAHEGAGNLMMYDNYSPTKGTILAPGQNFTCFNCDIEKVDNRHLYGRVYVNGANAMIYGLASEGLSYQVVIDNGGYADVFAISEPRDPGYDNASATLLVKKGGILISLHNWQVRGDPNYKLLIRKQPYTTVLDIAEKNAVQHTQGFFYNYFSAPSPVKR